MRQKAAVRRSNYPSFVLLAALPAVLSCMTAGALWLFGQEILGKMAGLPRLWQMIACGAVFFLVPAVALLIGAVRTRRAGRQIRAAQDEQDRFTRLVVEQLPGSRFWQWNWQSGEFTFADDWLRLYGFADLAGLDHFLSTRQKPEQPAHVEQRPLYRWEQLLHPDDAVAAIKAMQSFYQSARGGTEYVSRFRICDRQGIYHNIQARGLSIAGEDGKVLGLAAVYQDYTEQLTLQESLNQEKCFSESLINSTDLFVMLLDTQGRIMRFNPFAERITGYTEQELLGKSWIEYLFREAEKPDMRRLLERAKTGQYLRQKQANIMHREGREIEMIWHYHPLTNLDGRIFRLAVIGMDITDRRALEKQLFELAFTDKLTGLANQTQLEQVLQAMIRKRSSREESLSVVYFDLDHFKHVNDVLGYSAGDALLQWVAEQLRGMVREPDVVARLGEDEFILLLSSYRTERSVNALIHEIQQRIGQPWQRDNHSFEMTISTGVAFYPQHGSDFKGLLQHASIALFEAKDRGRNQVCYYDHQMHLRNMHYIDQVNQIHQAIKAQQFVLHYQLQYDLRTGAPRGAEALIRWCHPQRGLVPPQNFIPIAEAAGCINEISKWALAEACRQKQLWNQQGLAIERIAVNLSSYSFRLQELESLVCTVLDEQNVGGSEIELEITESALLENMEQTLEKIHALRQRGLSFVLDDFGTGYSSLSYLRQLPVAAIKIDRSFVKTMLENPTDDMIIRAIINLAHDLDLEVVAEGIETTRQMERLIAYGCDYGQGFLFHYPQAADQIILHELGHPKILAASVPLPVYAGQPADDFGDDRDA
jgi:diguanylate cyclase (GGDEF)-like protein/PAS domain S-box-containing protein